MMSLFAAATIIPDKSGETNGMAQENWRQVKDIFKAVLRQTPEERPVFLDRICGEDQTLRGEVESLLSSFEEAEDFMETPAVSEVADSVISENAQLAGGRNLGHYKIIRQIGAGGMGKVYLATDTKLNRLVALKVLHRNLSSDNQANRRLVREAQAAALLDHPHICQIHEISESGDGSFIVMQYVEGETLADILEKERLSVEKFLDLAIQIADALADAHTHNLIHRDIKPANIIVNKKGLAKVLDFGLAKIIEAESGNKTAKRLNSSGAVMGTVPYMSPEQLRGRRLDARSDIFSFGALAYEMLCGREAFARENHAETISAILKEQPDWTKIPEKLQPILKKSLMKDCGDRYQTAKELMRDLLAARQSGEFSADANSKFTNPQPTEKDTGWSFRRIFSRETPRFFPKSRGFYLWQSSTPGIDAAPETASFGNATTKPESIRRYRSIVPFALAIFLLTGAAAWLGWQFKNTDSHSFDALRPVRLVWWKVGAAGSNYSDYRVSHDGKMIAYSSTQNGENEGIYVKQTAADGEEIRVTRDEWNSFSPIWSPDDQRVAFVSFRENQAGIYDCPSLGGAAVPLKIIGAGNVKLRHWSKDGAAIFYELGGNLFRLDLATRETRQMTDFTVSPSVEKYFSFSPEEERIAYCDNRDGQTDVWITTLNGGAAQRLTNDKDKEMSPRWHPDGRRILYNVERDKRNQINLAFADGRAPEQITRGETEYEMIDVSKDGTKIYYTTWEKKSDISGVKIESGEEFEAATGFESEFWADVSPDGKSILFETNAAPHLTTFFPQSLIVVKSLIDKTTLLSLKGHNPRWLPDSRRIAFLRWQEAEKNFNLWLVNTATGEEKQITTDGVLPPSISMLPINRGAIGEFDFSPDGSRFVFLNKRNVWTASIESPEPFNQTNNANPNVRYYSPLWSPNGKRIVYIASEKPSENTQSPVWSVWLKDEDKFQKIYSTTASLRLLGWSSSGGEIFLEATDGAMKSNALDVKLLEVSTSGENRIVTTFKNIFALSMTLSADGKTVAFTARQNDRDDIFTAATAAGGEPKKITANGNSRLFFGSLAFSPDGKTIFFDKQDEISTISMFENFK